MLSAIVGINWGDEGKGRMVDLLGENFDIIVRYQGGNNAGHTVMNHKGKFILNLLPSGILRESTINVMGNGMVIDIEHLFNEINSLTKKGIQISPKNLKISDKAIIVFPFHRLQDVLEEERLADKKYGSTKRGIAPVYSDKYLKKGLRMGDLLYPETLRQKVQDIVDYKNLVLSKGYGSAPINVEEVMQWLHTYGQAALPYICDTGDYLYQAMKVNKNIMFEAQLGALRDIEFGIYPYTSSSTTLAAYAPLGSGIPSAHLDQVIGIMKAYSSCVGEGPFVVEWFQEDAVKLREAGGEYGAATGRPRRVGPFDVPASRYGVKIQGATELALTKLDILSYMETIPVCVAYEIDGKRVEEFPLGDALNRAKPIIEYHPGFKSDISKCRHVSELPHAAYAYIKYIERAVDCKIKYVSVGPNREDFFIMD